MEAISSIISILNRIDTLQRHFKIQNFNEIYILKHGIIHIHFSILKIEKVEECSYFVGNILVQVRHVFLPNYPLVLYLLKPKGVGVF